ncbi:hypothetical protein ACLKA6_009973 [Drosophila palustris]
MTSRSPSTASSAELRLSKRPSRDWIRFDSFRLVSMLQLLGRHFAPLSVAIATPHGQQTPDPIVPIGGWVDEVGGRETSQHRGKLSTINGGAGAVQQQRLAACNNVQLASLDQRMLQKAPRVGCESVDNNNNRQPTTDYNKNNNNKKKLQRQLHRT